MPLLGSAAHAEGCAVCGAGGMSGRSPASQSRPGWAVAGRALPLALLALFLPSCDTFQPSYPEFLRQRSHVCPSRYHLSGSGSPLRQTLQAARFATRAAAAEPEEAPQHERERLAELEKLLGVKFKDPSLLNQARGRAAARPPRSLHPNPPPTPRP